MSRALSKVEQICLPALDIVKYLKHVTTKSSLVFTFTFYSDKTHEIASQVAVSSAFCLYAKLIIYWL